MRRFLCAIALAVALGTALPAVSLVNAYQPVITVSVGTSATAIATSITGRTTLHIWNNDATKILYLGWSASVTTANGYPLTPGAWIEFTEIAPGQSLYGITTSGTLDVRVQAVYPQ